MIKNVAWNAFKNTGNIESFLEFKQIQEIENNILTNNILQNNINKVEIDEYNQNKWNNNFGK